MENKTYTLKRAYECTHKQKLDLLNIRNGENVRKAMYTDHIISEAEHLGYLESLRSDKSQSVFLVLKNDTTVVGMVSVSRIDTLHKKCDWAFYLAESERGGTGSALEFFMLDYVMNTLAMKKLNCEVIETNPAVVAMHKKFGFVEEGLRRENIEKDNERIGVHFLGITQAEWASARPQVLDLIGSKLKSISISMQ
jgi:UDP-4-amino-4,6-dideoxy-N-acetyl-beta-L-altrosamine N-acetyltransferase